VIDLGNLRLEIEKAVDQFAEESERLWLQGKNRYFLDLREPSHFWTSPIRAANTNGSVLLDRYVFLLTPQAARVLGLDMALCLLVVGVVTEQSKLFCGPEA